MNMSSNTILITGGASGIGYALAERFIQAGNKVIICGRRADKLAEAKVALPGLVTYTFDVSREEERIALFKQVTQEHPETNILLNNAGIMRYQDFTKPEDWKETVSEIEINLAAPVHLSRLFTEHLMRQKNAAIMNVTSGLAHVALALTPVYSATKAALHSFTLSLRHLLAGHSIRVIEISPPHTNTDLGIPGGNAVGIPVELFADETMKALALGEDEITYGWSQLTAQASRAERDEMFKQVNAKASV
ncbi:SDR family oxidoreductase [Paenibacillus sepulcri]|uniref:SDR family NAD(P)-dependent oxidoreductase n=1 Tax=Paenibacillus sepulcri TaxID=359917 RepID=A0ABS7CCP7_9BACL|nr:SDR family NAD(P)-dependent oxidoreductase [Paenibacillus sepulcri]